MHASWRVISQVVMAQCSENFCVTLRQLVKVLVVSAPNIPEARQGTPFPDDEDEIDLVIIHLAPKSIVTAVYVLYVQALVVSDLTVNHDLVRRASSKDCGKSPDANSSSVQLSI